MTGMYAKDFVIISSLIVGLPSLKYTQNIPKETMQLPRWLIGPWRNVGSNPVLSAQETYDSYARLVCTTDKLWRDEYQLHRDFNYFDDFLSAFLTEGRPNPGTTATPAVDVPNLLLTSDMKVSERFQSTMIHLGHHSKTTSSVPETDRPSFDPQWEKNSFNRYQRDLYVLSEMEVHLQKAVQDFSSWRDRYIEISTVPYSCEQ
ncbi:hypothetical protein BSL78_16228 [Apostichopus japonicus]|uniref:Uncharacterized protein n=1 Tax=Stichopus japonicus TaxID=307972 RepID=A0A2G8KFX2_STIJA|nr:hypothetical protein BSL78_16228 [Apostichopus japonicus]